MKQIYYWGIATLLLLPTLTNADSNKEQKQLLQKSNDTYTILAQSGSKRDDIHLSSIQLNNSNDEVLLLSFKNCENNNYSYLLIDSTDQVRMSSVVMNEDNKIGLVPYSGGIYYLKVNEGRKTVKTFKIVKK